ncbi:MAG: ABC transporter permease [Chloroflexi bacterium]|jgi:ABC-2 type transport system permease protein|nr:ABC transporter permease [Chloroflexota bacterium]
MIKVLDIALKDMTQSFRSLIAILFMFGVPLLMTAMFSLMFGNANAEDEAFVLPITQVILVNQDRGNFGGFAEIGAPEGNSVSSMGGLLTMLLESENFTDLLQIAHMNDPQAARAAVDAQEAGLAIILPADLTDTYMAASGSAEVEIYQDPALTVGPAIIRGIVSQMLDNFSASKIGLNVAIEQYARTNGGVDEAQIQALIGQYFESAAAHENSATNNLDAYLEIRAPQSETATDTQSVSMIAMLMTGMTIFYVFFTGPSTTQSILREEERGTLQRLFVTPTPTTTILSGKFLATLLTIAVQFTVLLLSGYLIFKIQWGDLLSVILLCAGITLAASAFGVFLISWMKSERQAGFMLGGLVTITGMAGMMPIFVLGIPNPPAFIKIVSLCTPQGWAVDGLQNLMNGSSLAAVLPNILVLLIWAVVFFFIGSIRFRNRYS